MSKLKTVIDEKEVISFLQNNFDKNVNSVNFITGGEMSQAFSFYTDKNYVIRINSKQESFNKDRYAFDHFASYELPIPQIFKIDRFNEKYYFAISELAKGKNLDTYSIDDQYKLLPQLISILDTIHSVQIDDTKKFGYWNEKGEALFESWKDYILNKKDDVYSNWEKLYEETSLEKEIVNQITEKINKLCEFLPEERYLVHGDYGSNNVTADGEKITGILDWGESLYGDFLYDVAWLQFWSSGISYSVIFKDHYEKTNKNCDYYHERLLCYQLHLGLGALGFFALSDQKSSYIWTKEKILSLM